MLRLGRALPEATIALSPGQRLGPYEILEQLGAGGMGEVYRAHDTRLRRDVALKVLRPSLATPEYVQRLSQEARAAGSLNHPNIVAVFDVGSEGPVPYVVTELLEGESLRQRLDRGSLPYRKALEYAVQITHALAAAHEKGILHRDVKPGNVFITTDGRVKLLDFGLAKLQRAEAPGGMDMDDSTSSLATRPTVIRGTVGYMAPEQILGEPLDQRADMFALGAVLYEMLTGRRAFHRPSNAETQEAVLSEEPVDLVDLNPAVPPPLGALVRRCLEKRKEERLQSARDLAFHLQHLEQAALGLTQRSPRGTSRRDTLVIGLGLAAVVGVVLLAALFRKTPPGLTFQQLTFHRGRIGGARFSSDGIVYSQAVEGRPPQVWRTRPAGSEFEPKYREADLLAAHSDKLALSTHRRFAGGERFVGTLAEVSGSEKARDILEDVAGADWDPVGAELAVARSKGVGATSRLEYPMGRDLYETSGSGSILFPRVSRDGRRVAFLEDLAGLGDGGRVVVVHRDGGHRILTRDWASARGLAWSPLGDEVWFTAAEGRGHRALRAVDLEGRERVILDVPGSLTIWDAAPDGRVLLTRDDERRTLVGKPPGGTSEVDLSWFDSAGLASLSTDGKLVLFGDRFGVYLRPTSGAEPVKLESKSLYPDDLSPDGRQVLAESLAEDQLVLLPTGVGTLQRLPTFGITSFSGARWFPGDQRRIVFNGRMLPQELRSWIMDLSGGPPCALTSQKTWVLSISPDGSMAAATGYGQRISLWPTDGGLHRELPGSEPDERPVAWSADGGSLWAFRRGEIPANVYRLEIATGRRELWKTLMLRDPAGVYSINELHITPDGNAYFYSYHRVLSQLYLVLGLR